MGETKEQVRRVMNQFGDDVKVKVIAQYLQDEYLIPYDEAVNTICELTKESI